MKKMSILLILLMILTKTLGFAREITLSYFYGASGISDAYLISLTIPGTIFAFIGTGLATSYIPIYHEISSRKSEKDANKYTNNVINYIFILCTIIIFIVFFFTEPIVKVFASGFEGEILDYAILFTKISVLTLYFSGLIYIFKGYLEVKGKFLVPAIMGIPNSVITIFSIFLSVSYGVVVISVGTAFAIFIQLLFMLPFVIKTGYRYSFVFNIKDKYINKMIHLSIPVIIGVSVNQINVLVDRTLASQIAVGGISMITYANRVNLFIQDIFVISIVTIMYPLISKMAANHNIKGLKKSLSDAIVSVSLLVLPAMVGTMIFAEPIIKLLFGRGAFDSQAVSITASALFFYSIGMIGFGLREVVSRGFYSMQDTKTPMINAAISMILNIILNIILSKYLGLSGLALATSISSIVCTLLLLVSLRKKIGGLGLKAIINSFIKISCASILMGVITKVSYEVFLNSISSTLSLVLSILIATVTYFVMIYFMNIEEFVNIIRAIKRRFFEKNKN
ncbi:murein biosynthesis integral membrane protein MurJ [Mesobacillus selenatarsenatis]|uniref:Probable lipid II flippase MurJ n=1 Tax=Mesobacillus selenatarsenatis TaxID=388741 RepID=A0A846TH10_9BACI|nr:murein biosynthesis integral membrane protein MurJ [Mesobacillus selenatarsenatis]NKE04707.1 murein biosynthesis integral membrane protein MurJ [Mesobacillus selenatarsenatis]